MLAGLWNTGTSLYHQWHCQRTFLEVNLATESNKAYRCWARPLSKALCTVGTLGDLQMN